MPRLLLRLWHDDGAALIATEWLFITTILLIGVLPNILLLEGVILQLLCCAVDPVGGTGLCPEPCPGITCGDADGITPVDINVVVDCDPGP